MTIEKKKEEEEEEAPNVQSRACLGLLGEVEISFGLASRAVDIPFALPMSFELQESVQLEGEIEGLPGGMAAGETRDWHPAKRHCALSARRRR